MKLENQVCSLELAKKLKELGVKQKSLIWWIYIVSSSYEGDDDFATRKEGWKLSQAPWKDEKNSYSAFTVAELGEMLPQGCASFRCSHSNEYKCVPPRILQEYSTMIGNTEADARAKMLIYLIENNLPTPVPLTANT